MIIGENVIIDTYFSKFNSVLIQCLFKMFITSRVFEIIVFILRFGHQDNSMRKLHSVVYSLKNVHYLQDFP
jgi:hypothetical protein